MNRLTVIYGVLIALIARCTADYPDAAFADYEEKVVIEGVLTTNENVNTVKVSQLAPINADTSFMPILNAQVWLTDEASNKVDFSHVENGSYKAMGFKVEVWENYTLHVVVQGTEYVAYSKVLPGATIDSVIYVPAIEEGKYQVKLYAQKPFQDTINFYHLNFTKNKQPADNVNSTLVFEDYAIGELDGITFPELYEIGDTVLVECFSIEERVYHYLKFIEQILNGNYYSTNALENNPPTQFTNGALGYFQASDYTVGSVVIK